MEKIKATVTMKNIYEYRAPKYAGYGEETRYIYTMQGEDGTTYVWKTSSFMTANTVRETIIWGEKASTSKVNKGDVIEITASVKGHSEYRGEPQTELQRVKVLSRIFQAKTEEEIKAEKEAAKQARIQAQADSIGPDDMIWRMPYRQYKEHYADCETVIDSFRGDRGNMTIEVIIREGRLKNSGVRGKCFNEYAVLFNRNGKEDVSWHKAICSENAVKQFQKTHPGMEYTKVMDGLDFAMTYLKH